MMLPAVTQRFRRAVGHYTQTCAEISRLYVIWVALCCARNPVTIYIKHNNSKATNVHLGFTWQNDLNSMRYGAAAALF